MLWRVFVCSGVCLCVFWNTIIARPRVEVLSCEYQAGVEVIHDRVDTLAGNETACVSEDLKC